MLRKNYSRLGVILRNSKGDDGLCMTVTIVTLLLYVLQQITHK